MRKANVLIKKNEAGVLTETDTIYCFQYLPEYNGEAISLTMPVRTEPYCFKTFPPFFDGLLPEGIQLEGLLRIKKIDKHDYFSQLLAVGEDVVGAITILPADE
ncbi:MAG: HipA N-terminal domain-containing protein [bacterium]